MLIAGEPSGDLLAAELVGALRARFPDAVFFGAGGARMAQAGAELVHEMSHLSVLGITDVVANLLVLRRLMRKLLAIAIERQPHAVIGVDYGGFNLRFGHAVKNYVRQNPFSRWEPKIIQFVSPQVWASRPRRADRLAEDYDLLLSIFPFEKAWYAQRVPHLRVEFVGHPMVDRFTFDSLRRFAKDDLHLWRPTPDGAWSASRPPRIVLLPGSRKSELKRHLPPMLAALKLILDQVPETKVTMIFPAEALLNIARRECARLLPERPPVMALPAAGPAAPGVVSTGGLELQVGNLTEILSTADLAITKTGTVTMECAFFGVPAVTLYKGSWLNYQIARHLITIKTFTMPNLLANEEVYPEFLQYDLTPQNLARTALDLLQNETRRQKIKSQLATVIGSLGEPGASDRAAEAVASLLSS